jgi:hypothetical protein
LTYTPVRFVACAFYGESLLFLEDVSPYRYFSVFRHPDLANTSASTLSGLEDRLIELTSRLVYKEYPSLDAFRTVIKRVGLAAPVVDRLLAVLARVFQARRFLPGPFCSSLVAMLFEDAGIPAFDTGLPHDSVLPGDLGRSRLQEITMGVNVQLGGLMNDALLLEEANGLAGALALADKSYGAYQGLRIGFERLKTSPSSLFKHDEEMAQLFEHMLGLLRETELLSHCSALNRRFWPSMAQIEKCWSSCSAGCKLPRHCKVNVGRVAAMVDDLQKQLDASQDNISDA